MVFTFVRGKHENHGRMIWKLWICFSLTRLDFNRKKICELLPQCAANNKTNLLEMCWWGIKLCDSHVFFRRCSVSAKPSASSHSLRKILRHACEEPCGVRWVSLGVFVCWHMNKRKMWMKFNSETLTEVVADRKSVVDFHAALETSLQTEEKLYCPFHLFSLFNMFLDSLDSSKCIYLCYYNMH